MSRLDELISELCPDGVEYHKLGIIAEVTAGNSAPQNKEFFIDGKYPFCRTADVGKAHISPRFSDISDKLNDRGIKHLRLFPSNAILMPKSGASTLLNHRVKLNVDSYVSSHLAVIIANESKISSAFLYHFMTTVDAGLLVDDKSYPSLKTSKIADILVPVPPLPVQHEIVRILDSFTELTAELAAELAARKKQYEYFKRKILFSSQNTTKQKLREIAELHYGQGNKIPDIDGEYPVYGCKGIVGTTNRYNSENASIIGHIGSAGSITWGEGKHFVTYNGTICRGLEKICISRYLYHILTCLHLEKRLKGNQPFLSISDFDSIEVPIPSIDEQKHIVEILDRFDRLCNSISIGLPAEIAARQKQYEYYRDKLLTFKPLA